MKKIWAKDRTETEIVLNFNDYTKHLGLEKWKTYGKMLDVGASYGDFWLFAKKHNIFPDTEVQSIDINPDFVSKWKKMWANVVEMNATDLKYPNEEFDTIISHASMPHCLFEDGKNWEPDWDWKTKVTGWITETMRVLKKWWELRFLCPAEDDDNYRGKAIFDAIKEYDDSVFDITTLPEDIHTQPTHTFVMKDSKGNIIPQKNHKNITYILKKRT